MRTGTVQKVVNMFLVIEVMLYRSKVELIANVAAGVVELIHRYSHMYSNRPT